MLKFSNPFKKENRPRLFAFLKKLGIGLSIAFNFVFLLLLILGLATPTVKMASASDGNPYEGLNLVNPLGLDISENPSNLCLVSTGEEKTFAYLPIRYTGEAYTSSNFVTSYGSSGYDLGNTKGNMSNSYVTYSNSSNSLSASWFHSFDFEGVLNSSDLTMPGVKVPIGSDTLYLSFVDGGNGTIRWYATQQDFTLCTLSLDLSLIRWPNPSMSGTFVTYVIDYSFDYPTYSFLTLDGTSTSRYFFGSFNPLIFSKVTFQSAPSGSFQGFFYGTFLCPSVGVIPGLMGGFIPNPSAENPYLTGNSFFEDLSPLLSLDQEVSFILDLRLSSPAIYTLDSSVMSVADIDNSGNSYYDGYSTGYTAGDKDGYNRGYESGVASSSPITSFSGLISNGFNAVASVLNLNIFGLTLGTWILIPVIIMLILRVISLFNNGG